MIVDLSEALPVLDEGRATQPATEEDSAPVVIRR